VTTCPYCEDRCSAEEADPGCASCVLYNAAVSAIKAAALSIANARHDGKRIKDAWINPSGCFGYVDGICVQIATAAEVAPFTALTQLAIKAGASRLATPILENREEAR